MKLTLTILILLTSLITNSQETHKRELLLMGSNFDITVVAKDSISAMSAIDMAVAEISRIEKLISSWDPDSETSAINKSAGVSPIKVSEELFNLITRCISLSGLTDGAFDISYASMDRIWKFDGSMKEMPSQEKINASIANVGYKNILLDKENHTVFLKNYGMKIGFGGIGKGYAADVAKNLLQEKGIIAGIINASGDMNTWGKQPNGSPWKVAITNPLDKEKAYALLPITGAVATSGNYVKYVEFNGKRYSHIIDPRTGFPSSGIISATVFAPSAELADALATSFFIMDGDIGLDRIEQLPSIECILIKDNGSVISSKNIQLIFQK